MSPMQHELLARTTLADRRREAARFHPTRSPERAWRDRLGSAMVGAGDRLRETGRRLQAANGSPTVSPCVEG